MALDKSKVQRAREDARQKQREVRADFEASDDHAYRVTLDRSYHFYSGMICAYTAILEGTHNEETGDPLNEPEEQPKKRGKKNVRARR